MALFEVRTDKSQFNWSTPIPNPEQATSKINDIMSKLSNMEPTSKTIEVRVIDPNWCNDNENQ